MVLFQTYLSTEDYIIALHLWICSPQKTQINKNKYKKEQYDNKHSMII